MSHTEQVATLSPDSTVTNSEGNGIDYIQELQTFSREYYIFASSLIIMEGVVALFSNIFVIIVILSSVQLRSQLNNLFLVNIAASDFLYPVMVNFLMAEWNLSGGTWHHGDVPCRLLLWSEITMVGVSNLALATYSIVKYIYIAWPFVYERWITRKWVLAVVLAFPWLIPLPYSVTVTLAQAAEVYSYIPDHCIFLATNRYRIVVSVIQFVVPFFVITVCGVRVLLIARTHIKGIAQNQPSPDPLLGSRASWKGVRSFLLMVMSFVLLQGPWMLTGIVDVLCENCVPMWISWEILPHMLYMSSMLNPFIYLTTEKLFRQRFLYILCCRRQKLSSTTCS